MLVRFYRWRRRLGFIVVAVTALTVTAVAQAEPWDGGLGYRSGLEQKLHDIGATYESSGGRFEYVCVDPANWADMGSKLGFDTGNVLGFVQPLISTVHTYLSPQACKGSSGSWRAASARRSARPAKHPYTKTCSRRSRIWRTCAAE